MNTKTPPNTAALKSLKNQGFKISISHYRRKLWKDKKEQLLADKKIRENAKFGGFGYEMVSERGGATLLELKRGEEEIKVRADCYHRDSFCKRLGVLECLKRLEKLHNIVAHD